MKAPGEIEPLDSYEGTLEGSDHHEGYNLISMILILSAVACIVFLTWIWTAIKLKN